MGRLKEGPLLVHLLLNESGDVLAALVALAVVVGVDELVEVLGIKVLLYHEVVGHGAVLVLGVKALNLGFCFVKLSAQVLDLLVRLL